MKASDYSIEFLNKLFEAFPPFQKYLQIENYEKNKKTYFIIKVPCPYNPDCELFITTYNDEIEIGFDFYHNHFSLELEHFNKYELAISFIDDILNETLIIAMVKNEYGLVCMTLKPEELAEINKDDIVAINSWKGSFGI